MQTEETDKDALESAENWADDQQKRGYYYDDAHGYEVYNPDDEDEDDDED